VALREGPTRSGFQVSLEANRFSRVPAEIAPESDETTEKYADSAE
jgi:hypothetical protein